MGQRSPRGRILIVDDDEDIRAYLEVTLELDGYTVLEAASGEEALRTVAEEAPDLVVLDVMMPGLDGYQVLRRLRGDARTAQLPVVLLTARAQPEDTVAGLEQGADDYVTKPFDADVLRARVQAALRRADLQRTRNPLTGLPGNAPIRQALGDWLEAGADWAMLYIDLDQFKPYNDHYGFLRGDEALRALAELLQRVARELGDERTFVGHVGGDDFVILCDADQAPTLADAVCQRFDRLVPGLYDDADREAGGIVVADRRGLEQRYPLVSVSIGVVSGDRRPLEHPGEVVAVATEMKQFVKNRPPGGGSSWAVDRRTDPGSGTADAGA